MSHSNFVLMAGMMATLFLAPVFASPIVLSKGLTLSKPALAYNTYIIFDGRDGKSHLIDMKGEEVKAWNYAGFPSLMIDPKLIGGKLGHVLIQKEGLGGHGPDIFRNKTVAELDWDGKVVWEWGDQAPGGAASQNHDIARLPNGNTLLVSTIVHAIPGFAAATVPDQCIYEVSPGGEIVWKWISSEHLDEMGFSEEGLAMIHRGFSISGAQSGFLVINNMKPLGPNHWYRAGDQRFHPDNIIIDSREGNFIAIIEKASGKIVWRIGPYYPDTGEPPYRREYNHKVPRPVDQLAGQHDANMIAEGLPGAGNILVFDNQGAAGFPPAYISSVAGSRVLEIDPVKKEIVWHYDAEDSDQAPWTFYSSFISSARRLPNENTLICEGMTGRIFQVTPQGQIVWEYVSPYFGRRAFGDREVKTNFVYRAQPVPYEWVPVGKPQ